MKKSKKTETTVKIEDFTTEGYPEISNKLLECLRQDFPDRLPRKFIDAYELGVLAGQQQVIDKLSAEKSYKSEKFDI